MLSPTEQWTLHSYYEFTKNLTDDELLAHRAGKAVAKLTTFTKRLRAHRAKPHPNTRKRGAPYDVRVFSQVNPDIELKAMATILIEIARERSKR